MYIITAKTLETMNVFRIDIEQCVKEVSRGIFSTTIFWFCKEDIGCFIVLQADSKDDES